MAALYLLEAPVFIQRQDDLMLKRNISAKLTLIPKSGNEATPLQLWDARVYPVGTCWYLVISNQSQGSTGSLGGPRQQVVPLVVILAIG